jgi:hypothetical protein
MTCCSPSKIKLGFSSAWIVGMFRRVFLSNFIHGALSIPGAFKSRALLIAKALEGLPKVKVEINSKPPGRGNFVVRVSGSTEPVVELLNLKRPYPPLKALDMNNICEVVKNAVAKNVAKK